MKMKRIGLFVFGLLGLVLLTSCTLSLAEDITPPPGYVPPTPAPDPAEVLGEIYPATMPDLESGAAIYAQSCALCHGDTGLADSPQAESLPVAVPAIGTPEMARASVPADWYATITLGRMDQMMPPFADSYSDAERWDVLAYVYSLSAAAAELEAGQALYQADCASCHGEDGVPTVPKVSDFTDAEAMVQVSEESMFQITREGTETGMPAYGDLSDDEIWALTAYIRSFTLATLEQRQNLLGFDSEEIAAEEPTAEANAPEAEAEDGDGPTRPETEGGEDGGDTVEVQPIVAEDGVVTGTVENGSGGEVPTGLVVTLRAFDNMEETYNIDTEIDADGAFRFESLELEDGRILITTADYGGITYNSEFVVASLGDTEFDLPLTIYETTTDPSMLAVDLAHIFFEFPIEDKVQVIEFYLVSNPSNFAVVAPGEDEAALTFPLPEGYENLQFETGEIGNPYVQTADGFGDPRTILPGVTDYQVLFAFEMPYTRSLEMVQGFDVPIETVSIFLPDDSVKVKTDALQDAGTQNLGDLVYHQYTSTQAFEPGSVLTLELSGRNPANRFSLNLTQDTKNLVIGLGTFLIVVAVGWWWLQNRPGQADVDFSDDVDLDVADVPVTDAADELMDAIIALDERYEAGEINADEYERQRAELKAQLRELI
ncbi:MAG: c-type cytochrome [Anaerolineales bacterium]|nr:c-type cytochrome [Anaerolineales bacterium]